MFTITPRTLSANLVPKACSEAVINAYLIRFLATWNRFSFTLYVTFDVIEVLTALEKAFTVLYKRRGFADRLRCIFMRPSSGESRV